MMNSDPWGSFQNFMANFRQMAFNPSQFVMQNYGIPADIANNPNAIIQKMMGEGKITQQQYNQARQAAMKIQSNPMFYKLLK